MEYKGFRAKVELSFEDGLIVGQVADIDSLIVFSAENLADLRTEFEAAIDGYLAHCEEAGVAPQKPYKGSLNVRCGSEIHKGMDALAKRRGVSLNDEIKRALAAHLKHANDVVSHEKAPRVSTTETVLGLHARFNTEEHYSLLSSKPTVAPDEPVSMRRRLSTYGMH